MSEGTPKTPKREMSLKESVDQIMSARASRPRHVEVVSEWNRALLDAQRSKLADPNGSDR